MSNPFRIPRPRSAPRDLALRRPAWMHRTSSRGRAAGFAIVGLIAALLFPGAARAERAALWLDIGDDSPTRAVLVDTVVEIDVLGMVAFVEVSQRYLNAADAWADARFVFPLPDQAAVDALVVRVGDRIIEGEIQERAAARATFEQARAEGRRAGLVEQERPNLFTTSVTNIGPGEEIEVRIGFQQPVRYDDGRFSLRFPTTLVPRFVPGAAWPKATQVEDAGVVEPDLDAARIATPMRPAGAASVNPFQLRATIFAGFELARIESLHHAIWKRRDGDVWRLGLDEESATSDRDLELQWTPRDAGRAQAAVYRERVGNTDYLLAMLVPPHRFQADHTPREVTLVVDTSGSMRGAAMAQARGALQVALAALTPRDRFNVIEFNSITRSLFPTPVPAQAGALAEAARFVGGLRANGGTVMAPALIQALELRPSSGHLRQVVFVTDGAVGNERELLDLIQREIGDARLFTVGIGHGVNDHFLRKAADLGRGSYTFIAHQHHVEARMIELLTRLTSPVLHDIELTWPVSAEVFPQRIPDLYIGEPLLVLARVPAGMLEVHANGRSDGQPWRRTLTLQDALPAPGVAKLWARRRIEALTDARGEGADRELVRAEITATALQYRLLSPYTSLVAVEREPARPAWEPLARHVLAQNPPHGRQLEGLVGTGSGRAMPQTASAAAVHVRHGLVWLAMAMLLSLRRWKVVRWRG